MEMYQDGVRVYCLPDGAICKVAQEQCSPLDLDKCPIGNETCTGLCFYYDEDVRNEEEL